MSFSTSGDVKEVTDKLKKAMKAPNWAVVAAAEADREFFLQLSDTDLESLSESNTTDRLQAIKALASTVKDKSVRENQVSDLWKTLLDLLMSQSPDKETERNASIVLMTQVAISGNNCNHLEGAMRHVILNYVMEKYQMIDTDIIFDLFCAAMDNGKNIELVEDLAPGFYAKWYPILLTSERCENAITLFVNLLKMNAAFFDEPELLSLVKSTIYHCNTTMKEHEGVLCLGVIEVIIAYCHIPSCMIQSTVITLSKIVCSPGHSERAWRVMRNILGTYIGKTAMFSCFELVLSDEVKDVQVFKGCVYFLYMGLWGDMAHPHLDVPFYMGVAVLVKAANHPSLVVLYEVAFALKFLVQKKGSDLIPQIWEDIFTALNLIYTETLKCQDKNLVHAVLNVVNDTVNLMEELKDRDQFCVMKEKYYSFISPFSLLRTESSAIKALDFLVKFYIEDTKPDNWLENLAILFDRYYNLDGRTAIKIKLLEWMTFCRTNLAKVCGTSLVTGVILPTLENYRQEEDLSVRCAAIDVLGDVAYNHNHAESIRKALEMLLRTLTEPFTVNYPDRIYPEFTNESAQDVVKAIGWLVKIFKRRIWDLPSADALITLKALVTFLRNHYERPALFASLNDSRYIIIEMIFSIRANDRYEIGMPDLEDAKINYGLPPLDCIDKSLVPIYTPYIVIDHKHGAGVFNSSDGRKSSDSDGPVDDRKGSMAEIWATMPPTDDPWRQGCKAGNVTYISLSDTASTILHGLEIERDWNILKLIYEGIPKMLQNKALIVSRNSNDINKIVVALLGRLQSESRFNDGFCSLQNTPPKFLRPDYDKYVFLAMSCLACYSEQLNLQIELPMVESFISGMVFNKCTDVCVSALTLCCLELEYPIFRRVNNMLQSLTKTSATVYSAQPVLEFLSTLLHLPGIYKKFDSEQFRYIFAVVVPYTHPLKFSPYIVILAFHVITMWFLKCKVAYRWQYVNYITKNLKNVISPEDLNPRKRSASLSPEQMDTVESKEKYIKLHEDMRITLMDLMSRYTYSSCTPMARRSEVAEVLIGGGRQKTWLIGRKLVTFTTSGCSQKPMTPKGICEQCVQQCNALAEASSKQSADAESEIESTPAPTKESAKASSNELKKTSIDVTAIPEPKVTEDFKNFYLCTCWCVGYTEVYIRQPTGNNVYMLRQQNQQQILEEGNRIPLDSLSALYGPGLVPKHGPVMEDLVGLGYVDPPPPKKEGEAEKKDNKSTDKEKVAEVSKKTDEGKISGNVNQDVKTTQKAVSAENADIAKKAENADIAKNAENADIAKNAENADIAKNAETDKQAKIAETSDTGKSALTAEAAKSAETGDKADSIETVEPAVQDASARTFENTDQADKSIGPVSPAQSTLCKGARPKTRKTNSAETDNTLRPGAVLRSLSNPEIADEEGHNPHLPQSAEVLSGDENVFMSPPPSSVASLKGESKAAPQSPSKMLSRFGNRFKLFGIPSTTSSVEENVTKRTRHASTKTPSVSSGSQPNVSSGGKAGDVSSAAKGATNQQDDITPTIRGRLHTISVMNSSTSPSLLSPPKDKSPPPRLPIESHMFAFMQSQRNLDNIFKKKYSRPEPGTTTRPYEKKTHDFRGGVTPSNSLLQMMYSGSVDKAFDRPLLVPVDDPQFKRSLDVLDQTPPLEVHKIGVVYVMEGQTDSGQFLGNRVGSPRYNQFLSGLGSRVNLKKASKGLYLPGLGDKATDGEECYVWTDEVMQVAYHVATCMPNQPNDPQFNSKRGHIGNDFVCIVYNESSEPYNISAMRTAFHWVIVEIRPTCHNTNTVNILMKPEAKKILRSSPVLRLVTDTHLSVYVRQLALHAEIACIVQRNIKSPVPYPGSWLSRLSTLNTLRSRLIERHAKLMNNEEIIDFTDILGIGQ